MWPFTNISNWWEHHQKQKILNAAKLRALNEWKKNPEEACLYVGHVKHTFSQVKFYLHMVKEKWERVDLDRGISMFHDDLTDLNKQLITLLVDVTELDHESGRFRYIHEYKQERKELTHKRSLFLNNNKKYNLLFDVQEIATTQLLNLLKEIETHVCESIEVLDTRADHSFYFVEVLENAIGSISEHLEQLEQKEKNLKDSRDKIKDFESNVHSEIYSLTNRLKQKMDNLHDEFSRLQNHYSLRQFGMTFFEHSQLGGYPGKESDQNENLILLGSKVDFLKTYLVKLKNLKSQFEGYQDTNFDNLIKSTESLIYRCIQLIDFSENANLDIKKWLSTHLATHFRGNKDKPKPKSFFRILFLGKLACTKYQKDNGSAGSGTSGRARVWGHKPSWSLAFGLGPDVNYGKIGFIFNALKVVENKKFALRPSTGGCVPELHLWSKEFHAGRAYSPGATCDLTSSFALVPNLSGFIEGTDQIKKGDFNFPDEYGKVKNSDFVKEFVNKNVIFYDPAQVEKLKTELSKSAPNAHDPFRVFGRLLRQMIPFNMLPLGDKTGYFAMVDFQEDKGETYQGDYSGPILFYGLEKSEVDSMAGQYDARFGWTRFIKQFNDFPDWVQAEIKSVQK
ncbi:hypothetical protein HN587_07625 [Candidatus Woesearchaeota archaeon]|jgi:hypothetical protein|nr:hypothetical protein [Candidatus Woesearchaeota archaeon]